MYCTLRYATTPKKERSKTINLNNSRHSKVLLASFISTTFLFAQGKPIANLPSFNPEEVGFNQDSRLSTSTFLRKTIEIQKRIELVTQSIMQGAIS